MMEKDYNCDTLTIAQRNRAASRVVFQQWLTKQPHAIHEMSLQNGLMTTANEQQYYIHQPSTLGTQSNQIQSQQQQQQQQIPQSINVVPSPIMMLHRTPSGAQRKIRQRKEEKNQQLQTRFSNIPSRTTTTTTTTNNNNNNNGGSTSTTATSTKLDEATAKSLVDLHGYESILPDDNWHRRNGSIDNLTLTTTSLTEPPPFNDEFGIDLNNTSSSSSSIQLNRFMDSNTSIDLHQSLNFSSPTSNSIDKPIRPPRSTDPSTAIAGAAKQFIFQQQQQRNLRNNNNNNNYSGSSFDEAIIPENESFNGYGNFSQFQQQQSNVAGYFGNKPTVQVHPMPTQLNSIRYSNCRGGFTSTSSISPPDTLKKSPIMLQPPPVPPKKPLQLGKRLEEAQKLLLQQQQHQQQQRQQQQNHQQQNQQDDEEESNESQENSLESDYCKSKNDLSTTNSLINLTTNKNNNNNNSTTSLFWTSKTAANGPIEDFHSLSMNYSPTSSISNETTSTNQIQHIKSFSLSSNSDGDKKIVVVRQPSTISSNPISHSNSLGSLLNTSLLRCDAEELLLLDDSNSRSYLKNIQSTSNSTNTLNCSSPSLLSLQRCLTHAYQNPEQHTRSELMDLEAQRLRSIESLSRKASERRVDLEAVCHEMENIDQIRAEIFKTLSCDVEADSLLARLRVHIVQGERLLELETRLQSRLENERNAALRGTQQKQQNDSESTTTITTAGENEQQQQQQLANRKRRLAQQMQDVLAIRASYDSRDAKLEFELAQLLNNRQLLLEWRFYRANALKLSAERRQLDEKLRNVRYQLEALEAIVILPQNGSIDE